MSGEHFTGGEMPHKPIDRIDIELYKGVEANVVYGCTDVLLRDKATGKVFLGDRQTEPQLGPWLVGGRNKYASGISENAALQVKNDLGLELSETRFDHIATYSTDFPIAAPGREEHGRHTMNAVMLADLTPDEVATLNSKVVSHEIRDEYSSGAWYDVQDIADPESDFPDTLKQMVRDLYQHDTMRDAVLEDAYNEHEFRLDQERLDQEEREEKERIASLSLLLGVNVEQANRLEQQGGKNTMYSVMWAYRAAARTDEHGHVQIEADGLKADIQHILSQKNFGDVHIKRALIEQGVEVPAVRSENGPALRMVLETAATAVDIDKEVNGELFRNTGRVIALQDSIPKQ